MSQNQDDSGLSGYSEEEDVKVPLLSRWRPHRTLPVSTVLNKMSSEQLIEELQRKSYFSVALGVSPLRWWVLFLYCFGAFNNALFSVTFAAVPHETKELFGDYVGGWDAITNMMLISALAGLVGVYPAIKTLSCRSGLKFCIQIGSFLVLIATIARLVPFVLYFAHYTADSAAVDHKLSLAEQDAFQKSDLHIFVTRVCLITAHALNGLATPFFLVPPAQISVAWFPSNWRTTVTGVALAAGKLGLFAAFTLASEMNNTSAFFSYDYRGLQQLCFHLAVISFISCLSLSFLPARPAVDPNISAVIERHVVPVSGLAGKEISASLSQANIAVFLLAGALVTGSYHEVAPLIPASLVKYVLHDNAMHNAQAALATFLGAIVIGVFADTIAVRKTQPLLLALTVSILLLSGVYSMLVPHPEFLAEASSDPNKYTNDGLKAAGTTQLQVIVWIVAFAQGMSLPLWYELATELVFPMQVGGGLFVAAWLLVHTVYSVFPGDWGIWYDSVFIFSLLLAVLGLAITNVLYRRADINTEKAKDVNGEQKRKELPPQEANVPSVYGSLNNEDFLGSLHIRAL